jgi:hypothetical protein
VDDSVVQEVGEEKLAKDRIIKSPGITPGFFGPLSYLVVHSILHARRK